MLFPLCVLVKILAVVYGSKWEVTHSKKTRPDRKKPMPYMKSVTSIHPETGLKIYATDKKLNFVPQCYVLYREFINLKKI